MTSTTIGACPAPSVSLAIRLYNTLSRAGCNASVAVARDVGAQISLMGAHRVFARRDDNRERMTLPNTRNDKFSDLPDKETLASLAARVDRHVGQEIRKRRQAKGVTQQELARALGISYQQIQKYENGANRVSAGRLFIIARALDTEIGAFFESFGLPIQPQRLSITSEETVQAARELSAVSDPRVRNSIRALVRLLSDSARARH